MDVGVVLLAVVVVLAVAFLIVFVRGRSADSGEAWTEPPKGSAAKPRPASHRRVNWLIGRGGGVEGKTFHVGSRTATIGRGLGNYIQISDEKASKVHAQLTGSPTGVRIKDMDSSNGTLLNGESLDPGKPRRLSEGDEIAIGEDVFVFRKSGNFQDEGLTAKKDVKASQQKKTMAFGAIGGGGDLKTQIKAAVAEADGDYEKAAEKVGLDAEMIKKIMAAEEA
jgi:pSer/pThr/pTyr-binding forkhead associated (FHA) protein